MNFSILQLKVTDTLMTIHSCNDGKITDQITQKIHRKEVAEVGMPAFKSAIISSKDKCLESIKKVPEGTVLNSSSCFKWWRLGDSNS